MKYILRIFVTNAGKDSEEGEKFREDVTEEGKGIGSLRLETL